MRSSKRGHGASRHLGQTGQDGLIRAKFDGRPKNPQYYITHITTQTPASVNKNN